MAKSEKLLNLNQNFQQNPYKKRGASLSIVNCLEFTYINKFKLSDKKFVHNDITWK